MKYERRSARCRHPSQNLKENIEYFDEYICFNLTKQHLLQNIESRIICKSKILRNAMHTTKTTFSHLQQPLN